MSKRALIYARVSYDDRKNEARNLEGQIEDGRAYCQEQGYRIVKELAEDDRGASGASFELPMLNQALEMATAGEFDVFVVREVDRLSRNLAKQLIVEQELKRAGVSIEYVLGEYPDTPEGRLNKHIRATIAEFEREKIAQRMTRGRRQVVKGGKVMLHGGKAPYGYRSQEKRNEEGRIVDKGLIIYEPEARIVGLIYHWYVYGDDDGKPFSINAIAKKLTGMNVPTWVDVHQGGIEKKEGYGVWSSGSVKRILSREVYAGTWYYGKTRVVKENGKRVTTVNPKDHWLAVEVPSIVSREVWKKAQERKAHNRDMAKRNNGKNHYLLSRRVTCQCGTKMAGRTSIARGKRYSYYICSAHAGRIANKTCNSPHFRADHTDAAVWERVKGLLMHPEALRQDLEEQQAEQELVNQPLWDRLAVIDDLLADNRRQLKKLLDLYLSGDFGKEMLIERKSRLESTIATLEKEQGDLLATIEGQIISDAQIATITDFAEEVSEGLTVADEDFDARRQIIDLLDVRVTLAVEDGQKVVYVRCLVDEIGLPIVTSITRNASHVNPLY